MFSKAARLLDALKTDEGQNIKESSHQVLQSAIYTFEVKLIISLRKSYFKSICFRDQKVLCVSFQMHVWMFDLTCSLTSTLITAEFSLDSFVNTQRMVYHIYILKTIIDRKYFSQADL